MNPAALSLALFIVQEAIKLEPGIAEALRDLFTKPDPTESDWSALKARIIAKSYNDYVPDSALPPTAPAPAAPAEPPVAPAAAPTLTIAPVTPPAEPPPAVAPAAAPVAAPQTPAPAVFTGQVTDPSA